MSKPVTIPRWSNVSGTKTAPSSGQQDTGFATNAVPTSGFFNWLFNLYYQWVVWLDAFLDTAHTWTKRQDIIIAAGDIPALHAENSATSANAAIEAISNSPNAGAMYLDNASSGVALHINRGNVKFIGSGGATPPVDKYLGPSNLIRSSVRAKFVPGADPAIQASYGVSQLKRTGAGQFYLELAYDMGTDVIAAFTLWRISGGTTESSMYQVHEVGAQTVVSSKTRIPFHLVRVFSFGSTIDGTSQDVLSTNDFGLTVVVTAI